MGRDAGPLGEGLATELAFTAVDVGFEALELERLIAFTLPHNIASRRVMEKAGFTYEREIVHATLPHVLYRRGLGAERPCGVRSNARGSPPGPVLGSAPTR